MKNDKDLDIAIVGGGVAGIVAAYLLSRRHRVSLYEKNDYVGGHTHTITVYEKNGRSTPVDTGFIVFNDRTYPNFTRFLSQLGVSRNKSPMSFSYWDPGKKFAYNTTLPFADPKNLLRPSFWLLLFEIVRFNRLTQKMLHKNRLRGLTLGGYLKKAGFSDSFTQFYALPISAAIWSTSERDMEGFPAEIFARFFENHGLLSLTRQPQWYTIKGGSHEYVKAFLKQFSGKVYTRHPVHRIARQNGKVVLRTDHGECVHDKVVIAAHGDEAFGMLEDPSNEEVRFLSPWRYTENRVILHRDVSCLPPLEKTWGSWNYTHQPDFAAATLTYYMNRLQQLASDSHYCVSLNTERVVKDKILADLTYSHPLFTGSAVATQPGLPSLNGVNNTWFCGSYFRYGFHEDAVMSAVAVARDFGVEL